MSEHIFNSDVSNSDILSDQPQGRGRPGNIQNEDPIQIGIMERINVLQEVLVVKYQEDSDISIEDRLNQIKNQIQEYVSPYNNQTPYNSILFKQTMLEIIQEFLDYQKDFLDIDPINLKGIAPLSDNHFFQIYFQKTQQIQVQHPVKIQKIEQDELSEDQQIEIQQQQQQQQKKQLQQQNQYLEDEDEKSIDDQQNILENQQQIQERNKNLYLNIDIVMCVYLKELIQNTSVENFMYFFRIFECASIFIKMQNQNQKQNNVNITIPEIKQGVIDFLNESDVTGFQQDFQMFLDTFFECIEYCHTHNSIYGDFQIALFRN